MKKKIFAALICASMIGCLAATPVLADETVKADGDYKIAVITMDSVDQHWVSLKEGAEEEAKADDVTVDFMAPDVKDDAKQIECINNAVAGGYDALMVAANSEDAVSGALQEAIDAGMKLVYVDSPANVEAEATFSTDNKAAGKTAGEEMIKALEDAGVTSGKIGIVNVNAATDSTVKREAGFRKAFEGKGFELMETQYGEGDAAKSQTIAENYITQGVVGIFGCNEGSTTGTGNAIKASGNANIIGVGFDKSDAIMNLINDGYLLCTMAQNPDVMGEDGVKAAVAAIKGESLGNVAFGIDYLANSKAFRLGDDIAVIGVGNSAMDCARTAIRNGARHVTCYARRDESCISASEYEVSYAKLEGVGFRFCKAPVEIRENGLICRDTVKGEDGKFTQVEGSEIFYPHTGVIVSVSQGSESNLVKTTTGIETNQKGLLTVSEDGSTTREGVFAGGDAVMGARTVVEAVAVAKKVAESMDAYMKSLPVDDAADPYADIPVFRTPTSDVLAKQEL